VWIVLAGKPPKKRKRECADDISTVVGVQIPPVHSIKKGLFDFAKLKA
jgi:hypothetical protein